MNKFEYYEKVIHDAFELLVKDRPITQVYGTPETSLQFGVLIKLAIDEIGIQETFLIFRELEKLYA